MARVGLEQLDAAFREVFELLHDRGRPVEFLNCLEKRVLDIDDPFVHATEYYHLVMLSLTVWDMVGAEAVREDALNAVLEDALEFILQLPLEFEDSVWHVRDTRYLDVVESDRQSQDAELARHVFGPNDFSAQPPLVDGCPTTLGDSV